jgi:adenylate cyclase
MADATLNTTADAIAAWLTQQTLAGAEGAAVLEGTCSRLLTGGLALERVAVGALVFHPQFDAMDFVWSREAARAERQAAKWRDIIRTPSPFLHLIETGGEELRVRLSEEPALPFPVLHRLKREGVSDYIAFRAPFGRPPDPRLWPGLPLNAAEGIALSFATVRPEGFLEEELAVLRRLVAPLAVALKGAATMEMAETLLTAYLGTRSGRSVLQGQVRRGDGQVVRAVLLHSDLRGSTALAESLPLDSYLATVNTFFDAVIGAVMENDGEVLKLMGDGILAIFPFGSEPLDGATMCQQGLAAARATLHHLSLVNAARSPDDAIRCGIALHAGHAMYGNVGSQRRLDITVMGPAINEVFRLEALCKTLSVPIVISDAAASLLAGEGLRSLGHHQLPGVRRSIGVFTPDDLP